MPLVKANASIGTINNPVVRYLKHKTPPPFIMLLMSKIHACLLDLRRFCSGRLNVIPQFLQGVELPCGMSEVAALLGRGHGGDKRRGIGDTVLQFEYDSKKCRRGLFSGEAKGAFAVEVVADGVSVDGDGFGFGEHSHIRYS